MNYRTSEILIKTLSGREATAELPSLLTSTAHNTQFTRRRNHLLSVETDTAITWKARKTSQLTVYAANGNTHTHTLCVSVHSVIHVIEK